MTIYVDVPACRVHEISPWFVAQGVEELGVIEQSGWLFMNTHYRMSFYPSQKELATLFKLTFGGES